MRDEEMSSLLGRMPPAGRDVLRRLMRADQLERDEFARALLRAGTPGAGDTANLLDLASLHPDLRRQLARVLGELETTK